MLLYELFEPGEMTEQLRQAALDYLTPLLGQNVPFVTIDQMIEALRHGQFGIVLNRSMIMDLLDPDQVEAVSKIEGDRIYLSSPDQKARELDSDDAEKDQAHVADMAVDQVKKSLTEPQQAPKPTVDQSAAPDANTKQKPPPSASPRLQ